VTKLFVTVSDLTATAQRAQSASHEIRSIIGSADDLVDSLEGSFEGQTAEGYSASIDNWVKEANGLMAAVEGLAQFLTSAAKAVQDVDTKLAEALEGGGSSNQITADSEFLTTLSTRVGNIADELDGAAQMFDGSGFRSGKVEGALEHFRKDWSDARKKMIESLKAAKEMSASAAEVYSGTDDELTKALQG